MKLFDKKTKASTLEVLEEQEPKKESTLNIDYLNEVNDEPEIPAEPVECMGVKYIDKKKIEDEAVELIKNLSEEEKKDVAKHLRPIIKRLISEEYKNLLMRNNAISVSIESDSLENVEGVHKAAKTETGRQIINTEEEFISIIDSQEDVCLAFIYAANKEIVEKRYGAPAANNITTTILSKLKATFTDSIIFANKDEYAVCSTGDYESFIANLGAFRKAIFAVNTSNQFRFPIELNISDVKKENYDSAIDMFEAAKKSSLNIEENVFEEEIPIVEEVVEEEPEKPQVPTYKVEFIEDDDLGLDFDIKEEPSFSQVLEEKDLSDFPNVVIKATITDTLERRTIKSKLIIYLIDQSPTKQEIVVSGHIGDKPILLASDYNDDKTTILLDENLGFILRFGSSIKTFILKDKKDRYELWQEISKNTLNKQPLKVLGMYICPISKKENKAAFIYTKDDKHTLIKTDEEGLIQIDGRTLKCVYDGSKFIVGIK